MSGIVGGGVNAVRELVSSGTPLVLSRTSLRLTERDLLKEMVAIVANRVEGWTIKSRRRHDCDAFRWMEEPNLSLSPSLSLCSRCQSVENPSLFSAGVSERAEYP